jgi:hypothetical protein
MFHTFFGKHPMRSILLLKFEHGFDLTILLFPFPFSVKCVIIHVLLCFNHIFSFLASCSTSFWCIHVVLCKLIESSHFVIFASQVICILNLTTTMLLFSRSVIIYTTIRNHLHNHRKYGVDPINLFLIIKLVCTFVYNQISAMHECCEAPCKQNHLVCLVPKRRLVNISWIKWPRYTKASDFVAVTMGELLSLLVLWPVKWTWWQ